jgi:hypothetical protein
VILLGVILPYLCCLPFSFVPGHVSGEILGLSWLVYQGAPLYHSVSAAQRWAPIYGPSPFLLIGLLMHALGPTATAMNVLGLLLNLGLVGLIWLATRQQAAMFGWVVTALFVSTQLYQTLGIDEVIILSVAAIVALLTTDYLASVPLALCIGALVGVLANTKIHSVLYVIPLLVARRPSRLYRPLPVALLIGTAVTIFALPFTLPQISLDHYAAWLRIYSRNGLDLSVLDFNLNFSGLLLCATYLAALNRAGEPGLKHGTGCVLAVSSLCMLSTSVIASKVGAGFHHLVPYIFVPAFVARLPGEKSYPNASPDQASVLRTVGFGAIAISFVFACAQPFLQLTREVLAVRSLESGGRESEINSFIHEVYPKQVLVAPGLSDELSWDTSLPIYNGERPLIISSVLMDMEKPGLTLPKQTIEAIRQCHYRYVLSPRGQPPFGLRSYYREHQPLYGPSFQSAFEGTYRKLRTLRYYDVWVCKGAEPLASVSPR